MKAPFHIAGGIVAKQFLVIFLDSAYYHIHWAFICGVVIVVQIKICYKCK